MNSFRVLIIYLIMVLRPFSLLSYLFWYSYIFFSQNKLWETVPVGTACGVCNLFVELWGVVIDYSAKFISAVSMSGVECLFFMIPYIHSFFLPVSGIECNQHLFSYLFKCMIFFWELSHIFHLIIYLVSVVFLVWQS